MNKPIPTIGAAVAALFFAFAIPVLALDGALDTTWHAGTRIIGAVSSVFVDPAGRVYLSSYDSFPNGPDNSASLIRLNADGSWDDSFSVVVGVARFPRLMFQPDGKIIYGGVGLDWARYCFGRLNENGAVDFWHRFWTPALSAQVSDMVLQPDGKIVAVGVFDTELIQSGSGFDPSASPHHDIARFNANGTWDESFPVVGGITDRGGVPAQFNATALALQADGKILVGGSFGTIGGQPRNAIARLNSDGSLDPSFNTDWTVLGRGMDGAVSINRIAVLADGKILLAGSFSGNSYLGGLVRLHSNGSLDLNFVPATTSFYINSGVTDFALQADGRILIVGEFTHVGGATRSGLARLNPDGSLDPTFEPDDKGHPSVVILSLALQDEGHLLIAGSFKRMGGVPVPYVARLLTAPAPLLITTQPQTQAAIVGTSTTLSVVATGTKPLSYQWRKNGAEIPGATGRTLSLPQVGFADAGDYEVVVTNPSGSLPSTVATLTVLNPVQPQSYAMLNGQYWHDDTYSGAGDPNVDLSPLSGGVGQLWDGNLGNFCGTYPYIDPLWSPPWVAWYSDAEITFDFGARKDFQQVAIHAHASQHWSIAVFSSADISFSDDGVTFGAATMYTPDHGIVGDLEGSDQLSVNTAPFTTTAEQSADGARWIPMPVSGSGRFVRLKLHGPSTYVGLWMISEVMFGGAVEETAPVPNLTTQPQSQTVSPGGTVSFAVTASGTTPISYQWRKDGLNLSDGGNVSGAATTVTLTASPQGGDGSVAITGSVLMLNNVQAADTGSYDVVVSNAAGAVTSLAAQLTVQPGNVTGWGEVVVFPLNARQGATFTKIAAGDDRNLALKSDGTVVAWGLNSLGQCEVPSGLSGVVAMAPAMAGDHTLALKGDGTVVAWGGHNYYGEATVPSSLSGVVAIPAGGSHSLALKSDATVVAWGLNYGNEPSGLSEVTAIAAGGSHSLALKGDGTVVAWGDNSKGQSTVPSGFSGVVAIAAGSSHSLALKSDGTVVAWGWNYFGVCDVPSGLSGVVAIAAGLYHSLALKGDGTVVAWGYTAATQVPSGLSGVTAIAGGYSHSLALKSDGTIVAWGLNYAGQLDAPTGVRGLIGVVAIAQGEQHSLALKGDGTVVAWGYNGAGQCNVPSGLSGVTAIAAGKIHSLALKSDGTVVGWGSWAGQVPSGLSGVVAIAANSSHSLALKSDGTVVAWGDNTYGQSTVPIGLSGVTAIAGGDSHSLALKGDGTVVAWGYNGVGACNVLSGLSGVVAVAAGVNHSLALKSDGTVVAWGWNPYGQCNVPSDLSGVVAIAAGLYHSLALKSDGTVVAWGLNGYGNVPSGLHGVVAIAAQVNRSLALFRENQPLVITLQPVSQSALGGGTVTFSVTAAGTPPLSYQWRKNGVALSGATSATFTISSVQASDTGSYDVLVSSPAGSVTSAPANLVVSELPSLVVSTTADTVANDGLTSLREAITYANTLSGSKAVAFNIPTTDPGYSGGVFTIRPLSALPAITSADTTIDGTTQTAFTGDSNPAGPEVVINGALAMASDINADGLVLQADRGTARGLVINGFIREDNSAGQANSGIEILGAGCRVAGCYLGTDATGTQAVPNWFGIWVAGANGNTIGGTAVGDGNLISANRSVQLFLVSADDNVVQGNFIGPDAAGMNRVGGNVLSGYGIDADSGSLRNLIGGTEAGARNVISGLSTVGLTLRSGSADNQVLGNFIGVAADGVTPLSDVQGVVIDYGAVRNRIGGTAAGEGNRIAFNQWEGVVIANPATGNSIRGNQIFDNGKLGINLWLVGGTEDAYGVTPNDLGDADTGANDLQNFPLLTSAVPAGAGVQIAGTLSSTPNSSFDLDFYGNTQADPSGSGEGEAYLGSITVTSDAAGNAPFSGILPLPNTGLQLVTATATDSAGNTSEFSPAMAIVTDAPPVPDMATLPTLTGQCSVTVTMHPTATDDQAGKVTGTTTEPLTYDQQGTYTITWHYNDGNGHEATQTQTVIVSDTAVPVITINGANPTTVECHTSFSDPGATASDNCAGTFSASAAGTVDANTPGTYTLTYMAGDPTGNAALPVTRTVNVVDTTKPVITLTGDATMTVECHSSFTDPGATANDACADSFAASAAGSVDANTPGSYTLTYTASDPSGNAAVPVTRTVNVVDTTKPTITLNGDATLTVECHSSFTDPGATANDACAGTLAASVAGSVDVNTPGTYTLTYMASDPSGNAALPLTRTVIVKDTTPPTITCPADISVACSIDQFVPVTFSATATDSCDPAPTITYSPASGSGFPIGVTIITCTATDASGNPSSCTFNVTRAPMAFTGFLAPIGGADSTGDSFAAPVRTFKMGSTVPVKFTASCGVSPVLTGLHRLQVIKYSDENTYGDPIDATPQGSATTGDQFRLADGQWIFNLDTKATGMSTGIWLLRATLSDGSQHSAWIQLK